MRVYALTDLGKKIADKSGVPKEESAVLQFLKRNKTGTDSEMDVVGELYVVKRLIKRGLVQELTT